MTYTKADVTALENAVAETKEYVDESVSSSVESALRTSKESGALKSDKDDKGDNGDTGKGIASVTQITTSATDDDNNTVVLSDGITSTFSLQNGSNGSAGYSPIRDTDYWTDADKAEIKSYVDDAILNGVW